MNPERYGEVKRLFVQAVDLDRDARGAFLEHACADDADLRREVESLLERADAPIPVPGPPPLREALGLESPEPASDPGSTGEAGPLPARIGRYRIVRRIGRGGMGDVYEAEQESPRRRVALKVIRWGGDSPSLRRRFVREAQLLGRLNHPGIAQIHEAGIAEVETGRGTVERLPFLAMEYVEGRPLLEHAAGLDLRNRLELVARICEAVQHAHEKGVIHRDLKPENVVVAEETRREGAERGASPAGVRPVGRPKVLDFGVARASEPESGATAMPTLAGQLVGTLAYMSPEQVGASPEDLDTRSDVYGLGVVLYEVLAGRPPFDFEGKAIAEVARQILEREPARLGAVDPRLRGDVETIVAKALEKDRERRYGSARELAGDLRRYLQDEPILARPSSGLYQLRKFARRNKGLTGGVALSALALAAGAAVALRLASIATDARDFAQERSGQAVRQARRARLAAAALAAELGDFLACRQLLGSIEPSDRHWEWRHLDTRIDTSLARIESVAPLRATRFAPSGEEILLADAAGEIDRWEPDLGRRRSVLRLEHPLTGPAAFDPGGTRLAGAFGAEARDIGLFDLPTGRRLAQVEAPEEPPGTLAVSTDGSRVAFGGATKCWLWEPGAPLRMVRAVPVVSVAFSADGHRGAAVHGAGRWGEGYFVDFDAASGELVHRERTYTGLPAFDVALNGDGSLLALAYRDKRVWLHDTRSDRPAGKLVGHSAAVRAVSFDRSGQRLASAGDDATVRLWEVRTGRLLATLSGLAGVPLDVAFSPDGTRVLAHTEKEALLWSGDELEGIEVLRGHSTYVYAVAFAAGGGRILSGGFDGSMQIRDAASGEILWERRGPGLLRALSAAARAPLFATAHERTVGVWDADAGVLLREFACETLVRDLGLSADGSLLAVRHETGVDLRDGRSGEPVRSWPCASGTPYGAVAMSPLGDLVASNEGTGTFVVWEADTGREAYRRAGHAGFVEALAFSADGVLLATGGVEGSVRLWDARTGGERWASSGHTDRVYAVAFSPDGTRLASGSNDTTIRLWDVATGEDVGVLRGHLDYVFSLAFSPDGTRLASASGDSTVRVWDTVRRSTRWQEGAVSRTLREEARTDAAARLAELGDPTKAAERLRNDSSLDPNRREAAIQALLLATSRPRAPK
ncbi:MAG: protein kinase [Planctomycetes bacterium]|nr:protein kinase [Planctomycetota bacterium]